MRVGAEELRHARRRGATDTVEEQPEGRRTGCELCDVGAEGLAIVERVVGEHLRRAEGVEVCFDRVEVGSVNVWLGGLYGARSWGSYRPLPDEV